MRFEKKCQTNKKRGDCRFKEGAGEGNQPPPGLADKWEKKGKKVEHRLFPGKKGRTNGKNGPIPGWGGNGRVEQYYPEVGVDQVTKDIMDHGSKKPTGIKKIAEGGIRLQILKPLRRKGKEHNLLLRGEGRRGQDGTGNEVQQKKKKKHATKKAVCVEKNGGTREKKKKKKQEGDRNS